MIEYIFLGIIQGLTEFLPVSSSGHLVILQNLLGVTADKLTVSVVLHLGTLLAVVIFFRKDILGLFRNPRMLGLVLVASAITGIIGISAKDLFERAFCSVRVVGAAWFFTGLILIFAGKASSSGRRTPGAKDACFLGLVQSLAIIPGVSRSGITISALLLRKIDPKEAFTFSFLVSIPLILAAAALEAGKINGLNAGDLGNLTAGFFFSLLTGLAALSFLRMVINKARFHYFGYYCLFVSVLTLIFIR
ncbi:MAG: undecaprenyl-diphosphate phosphatase [Candidatus Omnitrophota bacterium]